MKNISLNELPVDYKPIYAEKIYIEITHEKILYNENTIKELYDFYIGIEEYERCAKVKYIYEQMTK